LHSVANSTRLIPEDAIARYTLNSGMSRFRVQAFAGGLLSSFGHNPAIVIRQFSGEAQFDPAAPDRASLRMTIDARSLEMDSSVSDKDRDEMQRIMHEQVLQSDEYPEISYECSKVTASSTGDGRFWVVLNGDLTLHGITRSQKVAGNLVVNGGNLQATGDFSIQQSDYRIKLASGLGGALKVKDELKCSFYIVASKPE
jgi:polyisoprenoid-binding protein YceI